MLPIREQLQSSTLSTRTNNSTPIFLTVLSRMKLTLGVFFKIPQYSVYTNTDIYKTFVCVKDQLIDPNYLMSLPHFFIHEKYFTDFVLIYNQMQELHLKAFVLSVLFSFCLNSKCFPSILDRHHKWKTTKEFSSIDFLLKWLYFHLYLIWSQLVTKFIIHILVIILGTTFHYNHRFPSNN